LNYQDRKKAKDLELSHIIVPPHFVSIKKKAAFIQSVVNPMILPDILAPSSPVKNLILFDRETTHCGKPGTVEPKHMREISFLNYNTKDVLSIVLEDENSTVSEIDDTRLRGMALRILKWLPDSKDVYLGYWQCKDADMKHLLNLIFQYAREENKNRNYPICRATFIDYQREIGMKIFSNKVYDSMESPNTAIFSINCKLGCLSKKYFKGDEYEIPTILKVKAKTGDGKSVLDNCHVYHLLDAVGSIL
jgi:hypothetical protein